ncbi:MAG: DUF547 domain-containing protein [Saprospiraceae bacterium]
MKNLLLISALFLIFSCGGETKTDSNATNTTSTPNETEQKQASSGIENPQNSAEKNTKVLAKNEIKEELQPEKTTTKIPAKNISSKKTTTSKPAVENSEAVSEVKNEAEAITQIEGERAKALAKKTRLEEEEMKRNKELIKAKEAELKRKKEMEAKAAAKKAKSSVELPDQSTSGPLSKIELHDMFDALLKKHVSSSGVVNYKGFKKDEARLDSYLKALEKTNVDKNWSRNKALAFWINAYNANTIKLILKNYPIKSIMDLNNGKPWDVKWIKIDQRTLSLNNIENDIIRPKYNEPRIHFAVNCAAKSCPPLLNKAWTASNLNSNLERQAKSFINNSKYNTITSGNVEVSKIFDWYGKDFGDLKAYLNKYSSTTIGAGTSINFKTYNWDLNN